MFIIRRNVLSSLFLSDYFTTCRLILILCMVFFFFLSLSVFTGARLDALRAVLDRKDISAFLVPSGDSHQSEYIAKYDKRREWIGGFSGGAGFAAVTLDQAAMWVDGRYGLTSSAQENTLWANPNPSFLRYSTRRDHAGLLSGSRQAILRTWYQHMSSIRFQILSPS